MAEAALHRYQHRAHAARPRALPRAEGYRRHEPQNTALYRCVERHWPAFREQAEERGGLPKFVVKEVEEYLRCGILEHGCLRLACCREPASSGWSAFRASDAATAPRASAGA